MGCATDKHLCRGSINIAVQLCAAVECWLKLAKVTDGSEKAQRHVQPENATVNKHDITQNGSI